MTDGYKLGRGIELSDVMNVCASDWLEDGPDAAFERISSFPRELLIDLVMANAARRAHELS